MKCRVVFSVVSLVAFSLILASCGGGSSLGPAATVYVANSQSSSLSVISLPAGETVASVAIGTPTSGLVTTPPSYPSGVAVSPDGSRVYVTDAIASVWVIDAASNSVISTIAAGTEPKAIAITPDGKSAYVTTIVCSLPSCSAPQAAVEAIDTTSNSLKTTIIIGSLPTAQTPGVLLSGIAISPDGTRAYASNGVGNQIWAIDTASNQIVSTIPTAVLGFAGVSITPDGSHLYAASIGNPSVVDVVDTKTNAVVSSITVSNSEPPTAIGLTPDGNHAYVTGVIGDVWIIDTTQNTIVATVPVIFGPPLLDIAFSSDGTRAYIACGNNNTIYVLDTTSHHIVGHITSSYPGGLAIARPT